MLKITPHLSADATTLQLEGTLSGPWVAELEVQLKASRQPVRLDLSGVTFMDQQGVTLIEQSLARGATISAASHFAALMLQTKSSTAPGNTKEG